jgi:hypothetical protein
MLASLRAELGALREHHTDDVASSAAWLLVWVCERPNCRAETRMKFVQILLPVRR